MMVTNLWPVRGNPVREVSSIIFCCVAVEAPVGELALGELPLTEAAARTYLAAGAFRDSAPGRIGVELEWVVTDPLAPVARVPMARLREVLAGLPAALPGGGAVSVEPGGQLELSSAPHPTLDACVRATRADLAVLRAVVGAAGLRLHGTGLDPDRVPERVLEVPRYDALEEFNRRRGPEGLAMMCNSASLQVCVEAGHEGIGGAFEQGARWRLADALGPVLLACFANSPSWLGRRTGWKSTRQVFRFRTDPSRCRAPRAGEPRAAWARYALAAQVMCVRPAEGADGGWLVPDGLTFAGWLRGGGPRPATLSDLEFHVSTLFPPVRARGYLEFRMLDQQPGEDGWLVPLAVVSALFDDPVAAEAAAAVAPRRSVRRQRDWMRAARHGLADPVLAEAAVACFGLALAALERSGADPAVLAAVADFADRYPNRGRCPADDVHSPAYAV
jgi:glutamate--cysteine ligase